MAYSGDLLELAKHLASPELAAPRQAHLRRAVSTAYYALFHLLVSEATLNWARPELRSELGRFFAHGKMKSASVLRRSELDALFKKHHDAQKKINNASVERRSGLEALFEKDLFPSHELAVLKSLRLVAHTFIDMQQKREIADYDIGKEWDQTEVNKRIGAVEAAFEGWNSIREEPAAQAYLLSLLGTRPRSE